VTAFTLETLNRDPVVPVVGGLAEATGHWLPVGQDFHPAGHTWDAARLSQQVGGSDHHLRRDTAPIGALATEEALFDTDHVESRVSKAPSHVLSARPQPQDDNVRVFHHGSFQEFGSGKPHYTSPSLRVAWSIWIAALVSRRCSRPVAASGA
jgi:hypothetical protein